MARRKRRILQHVMEDESFNLVKDQLPKEWVIREFNRPDYGIDIVVELFEKIDEKVAETLGEYLYVQVKSTRKIDIRTKRVYDVHNVAKVSWREDQSEYAEIEVARFRLDTDSLYTVQSLGSSVVVMLFLADLPNKEVYFVCLNDYIEKILFPQNTSFHDEESIVIEIPIENRISNFHVSDRALRFYGKRAKLLSAFSKINYQKNEIGYIAGQKDYPIITMRDQMQIDGKMTDQEIKTQLLYFLKQLEDFDVWSYKEWEVLPAAKLEFMALKSALEKTDFDWPLHRDGILILWHRLANLGTMYEDLIREWYLPKMISLRTSYPHLPKIIKT
jgi:hypothetical protein